VEIGPFSTHVRFVRWNLTGREANVCEPHPTQTARVIRPCPNCSEQCFRNQRQTYSLLFWPTTSCLSIPVTCPGNDVNFEIVESCPT
jgi:hypothetical protein